MCFDLKKNKKIKKIIQKLVKSDFKPFPNGSGACMHVFPIWSRKPIYESYFCLCVWHLYMLAACLIRVSGTSQSASKQALPNYKCLSMTCEH